MFHVPQYVPRSLVANQDVRMRAQHGPPKPCIAPCSGQTQHLPMPYCRLHVLPHFMSIADYAFSCCDPHGCLGAKVCLPGPCTAIGPGAQVT